MVAGAGAGAGAIAIVVAAMTILFSVAAIVDIAADAVAARMLAGASVRVVVGQYVMYVLAGTSKTLQSREGEEICAVGSLTTRVGFANLHWQYRRRCITASAIDFAWTVMRCERVGNSTNGLTTGVSLSRFRYAHRAHDKGIGAWWGQIKSMMGTSCTGSSKLSRNSSAEKNSSWAR